MILVSFLLIKSVVNNRKCNETFTKFFDETDDNK